MIEAADYVISPWANVKDDPRRPEYLARIPCPKCSKRRFFIKRKWVCGSCEERKRREIEDGSRDRWIEACLVKFAEKKAKRLEQRVQNHMRLLSLWETHGEHLLSLLHTNTDTTALDCWVWTGSHSKNGYGHLFFKSEKLPAHRLSYLIHNGEIEGHLEVHHSCDSPFCVNPAHLTQGDTIRNIRDSMSRKRICHRDFIGRRWIPTREQVVEIKILQKLGIAAKVLSQKYGVSLELLEKIVEEP